MQTIDIQSMTLAGQAAPGAVDLPCTGQTYPLTVSIRARTSGGQAAAIVPIWVGEFSVFGSTSLIEDVIVFAPPAGQWQSVTRTYQVSCTGGCSLTAAGTGTARTFTISSPRTLAAAYYDIDRWPGNKWWYFSPEIDVTCKPGIASAVRRMAALREGFANPSEAALAALAADMRPGDTVKVTEAGGFVRVTEAGEEIAPDCGDGTTA